MRNEIDIHTMLFVKSEMFHLHFCILRSAKQYICWYLHEKSYKALSYAVNLYFFGKTEPELNKFIWLYCFCRKQFEKQKIVLC